MKKIRNILIILLSLAMALSLAGCGGSGGGNSDAEKGVNLKELLTGLSTSEEDLGLTGKYASSSDIPGAKVDPDLVGTWKLADGSVSYTYYEDGTAKAGMELYSENEFTFSCFTSGDFKLIAEDVEMMSYAEDGSMTTTPVVTYTAYRVENDALYCVAVEAPDEFASQSITQIIVLYKADGSGDISAAMEKNPVSVASFYGDWVCGDMDESSLSISSKGLSLKGAKALPVTFDGRTLTVGTGDSATAYSAALAYERLYDNSDSTEVTGENYVLGLNYTGADENDRPNLADVMDDWHADYGYEEFYFSLNAKAPVK